MFAVAALLGLSADAPPALRCVGAAPLAALMAAAREELGRERASSRVAHAPNSVLVRGSAPRAGAELAQELCELACESGVIARLALPNHQR